MHVSCRYCAATNEVQLPAFGSTTVVCFSCGRPFVVDVGDLQPSAPGRATLNVMPADNDNPFLASSHSGLFDSRANIAATPYPAAPTPYPAAPTPERFDTASHAGFFAPSADRTSGNFPAADGRSGVRPMAAATRSGYYAAATRTQASGSFRFAFDDLPPNESDEAFYDNGPSTRIIAPPASLLQQPIGWRLRNEKGVVYSLPNLDAVVAMLKGRSGHESVEISKEGGPFVEAIAFPELRERLAELQAPVVAPSQAPLVLEREHISPKRSVTPKSHTSASQSLLTPAEEASQPMGLGGVLLALGVTVFVVIASLAAAWTSGLAISPLKTEAVEVVQSVGEISPELKAAIGMYQAGHYTAATERLESISASSNEPQALHYLALALYKGNRAQEAREVLARYRQQIRGRKNGR